MTDPNITDITQSIQKKSAQIRQKKRTYQTDTADLFMTQLKILTSAIEKIVAISNDIIITNINPKRLQTNRYFWCQLTPNEIRYHHQDPNHTIIYTVELNTNTVQVNGRIVQDEYISKLCTHLKMVSDSIQYQQTTIFYK